MGIAIKVEKPLSYLPLWGEDLFIFETELSLK
jgi:hypothetical protein